MLMKDERHRSQLPLRNVNIENGLYQMFLHWKFRFISANGNCLLVSMCMCVEHIGSVHVTCERIFVVFVVIAFRTKVSAILNSSCLKCFVSSPNFADVRLNAEKAPHHTQIHCMQDAGVSGTSVLISVLSSRNLPALSGGCTVYTIHKRMQASVWMVLASHLARCVVNYANNFMKVFRA